MGTMTEGNFIEPEQNLSASRLVLLLGFFFLTFWKTFSDLLLLFLHESFNFFWGFLCWRWCTVD